jgi:signal transduction histidine kinase
VDDPAVERDFLERSQGIVGTMNELVGDLLELSRLESGTLRLALGPFSVAEVGARVTEQL